MLPELELMNLSLTTIYLYMQISSVVQAGTIVIMLMKTTYHSKRLIGSVMECGVQSVTHPHHLPDVYGALELCCIDNRLE